MSGPTWNRRLLLALFALALLPASAARAAAIPEPPRAPAPEIGAEAAILVDVVTGAVLYEKNARERRPNASTTKIATAIVILESGRLDEEVVFSRNAVNTPYANLGARVGERIPLGDLVYPIMLQSSNDGTVAAGEHLYGSAAAMARAMTEKAHAIGATDTNFITTNGLYHANHYSTAADLAQIARYALSIPEFSALSATRRYTIRRSHNQQQTTITNRNRFLNGFEGADGIKTGYVRQSGRCFVASATREEGDYPWRLIAVVLDSPDTNGESAALLEWGYQNFEPVFVAREGDIVGTARVSRGSQRRVPLVARQDLYAVQPRRLPVRQTSFRLETGAPLLAPFDQGEAAGTLVGYLNGEPFGEVQLAAGGAVARGFSGWPVMLAILGLLLGPRYARAFAETARRRRRRLPPARGGADPRGEGRRRWPARARTRHEGGPGNGDGDGGREAAADGRAEGLPRPLQAEGRGHHPRGPARAAHGDGADPALADGPLACGCGGDHCGHPSGGAAGR